MSQVSVLLLAVLFWAQPPSAVELRLDIGTVVPKSLIRTNSNPAELMATHPSQLDPFFEYDSKGVKYTIGFGEESRKITYIHTSDKKFRTSNGLHVGSPIQITREQARAYPGWLVFGPKTVDGWSPEIGFDSRVELAGGPNDKELLGTKLEDVFANSESVSVVVHGFAKHK